MSTTDRVFNAVTSGGMLASFARQRVAPLLAPLIGRSAAAKEEIFGIVSQTRIDYRDSPLSEGSAGRVAGGDRLPWVRIGESDNFAPLRSAGWQVHVCGEPSPEVSAWCERAHVPLEVFGWSEDFARAGFDRNATYLVRPDMHVALADASGSAQVLNDYFNARGIALA